MVITRLDWWLGIAVVCGALLCHAVFPRYEVHLDSHEASTAVLRFDRWTGTVEIAGSGAMGRWLRLADENSK